MKRLQRKKYWCSSAAVATLLSIAALWLALYANPSPAGAAAEPAGFMRPSGGEEIPGNSVIFTWPPQDGCVIYRVVVAEDPEMTVVILDRPVYGTAFVYSGKLKNSQRYYWRIMPVEPAPGDWSAVCSFHTRAAAVPAVPQIKKEAFMPPWATGAVAAMSVLIVIMITVILKTKSTHI